MKSGYKLLWSDKATADLKNIIAYLEQNWTQKDIRNFARKLERRLNLITVNPYLFPETFRKKNIRRSVLTKHTVIYYRISVSVVTIVTLFDTRQNPKKLKRIIKPKKSKRAS